MERSEYWLRLQFLLRISTKRLQQFFRIRYEQLNSVCWKPEYGAVYIEREKDVSKLLNKDQKAAMTIGVVEEWDISLLATLFLNDNALLGNNEHLKSHIKRLKEIRNQIAHNSSMSVPESTFESLWKELEQILIVSGESSSKLDQLRNLSFNEMEGVYHHGVVSEDMEKWKKLANDSFHASKFEEALEYYGKALRIPNLTDVNRGTLYSNRSVAHLKLENFEQSYADAKLAQQLRPDWPRSYLRKGNALLAMKNYAKAVLAFDSGLVLDPTSEELLKARGEANQFLKKQTRFEHMDDNFRNHTVDDLCANASRFQKHKFTPQMMSKMVNEMADTMPEAKTLQALFEAGEGKYKEAVKLLAEAVQKENVEAMYNLAIFYMEGKGVSRNIDYAKMLLEKAATAPPMLKIALRNVGVREAQNALGNMHLEGYNGLPNEIEAVQWFKKAVANGDDGAMNTLGVLYLRGAGVQQNFDKAYDLLHAAAMDGFARAMCNLGDMYLQGLGRFRDAEKALEWYQKASKKGFKYADTLIPNAIAMANEEKKEVNEIATDWEKKNGLSADNLTSAERLQRMSKSIPSLHENLETVQKLMQNIPKPFDFGAKHDQYPFEQLSQYSSTSKVAAELLSAKMLFVEGLVALDLPDYRRYISKTAAALRISELVVPFIPEVSKRVADPLAKIMKDNPHDRDAMLVYAHGASTSTANHDFVIRFLEKCTKAHPKALEFYYILSSMLCFQGRWEESLPVFNKAIQLSNDAGLYYSRGTAFRNIKGKDKEAMQDMLYFVKNADKDDRKLPSAYYSMALIEFEKNGRSKKKGKENFATVMDYFQLGLEFENNLLPFFKPYDFPPKTLLEQVLRLLFPEKFSTLTPKKSVPTTTKTTSNLDNPRRIKVRVAYRQAFQSGAPPKAGLTYLKTTAQGFHTQVAPKKLAGLKEIVLNKMDFTADKVYDGYCLTGTLIEPISTYTARHSIIEDEEGQIIQIAFYDEIGFIDQKMLVVGQVVTIMNPYMRQSKSGTTQIRVDDPKSVIFGDRKSICWGCCKSTDLKLMACSSCKKAQYCSKECQTADWKLYQHKLVCSELSKILFS